jgi:hypothetical protein
VYYMAPSIFYVGKRENAGGSLLDEFAQTIRKNHQYTSNPETGISTFPNGYSPDMSTSATV